MDPVLTPILVGYLAKFGIDAVTGIIAAWKESGEPTSEQIQAAFIDKKPEDYFKTDK